MSEELKPLLTKGEKIRASMQGNTNATRHGHTRRQIGGKKDSPTYRSWMAMRTRCSAEGRDNADRYADRGVTICDQWESFDNFLADMGERPEGKTLDRWPNAQGNYEPENCRWATPREQARNTRRNKLTLETATEVALMRLRGEECKVIATRFGISESLPREIVKGRCWPDALEAAKKIVGARND
jgi:hypothetical protein